MDLSEAARRAVRSSAASLVIVLRAQNEGIAPARQAFIEAFDEAAARIDADAARVKLGAAYAEVAARGSIQ